MRTSKPVRPPLTISLVAGIVASAAYLAQMALDIRLTGNRYDDLVLWGAPLSRDPRRQRLLGLVGHFGLGTALALVYRSIVPFLPAGAGWKRGLLFTLAEHLVTFPSVGMGERIHPGVRRGELPSLLTWEYFWLETGRHAAYGIALGLVMGRKR